MSFFVFRTDRDDTTWFCGVIAQEDEAKRCCAMLVETGARFACLKKLGQLGDFHRVESPFNYDRFAIPIVRPRREAK